MEFGLYFPVTFCQKIVNIYSRNVIVTAGQIDDFFGTQCILQMDAADSMINEKAPSQDV